MATIHVKDLEQSVELDRKAMTEVIGGRGPKQQYTLGTGIAGQAGMSRSATGSFRGQSTSLYKKK
jgi:hypothetical protein